MTSTPVQVSTHLDALLQALNLQLFSVEALCLSASVFLEPCIQTSRHFKVHVAYVSLDVKKSSNKNLKNVKNVKKRNKNKNVCKRNKKRYLFLV